MIGSGGGARRNGPPTVAGWEGWGTALALALPVAAYLVYIVHYSVDGLWFDDYGYVPEVHAFLAGHPTWSLVWAQHNEQRAVFPSLVYAASAAFDHFNTRGVELLGAVIFSLAWVVLLWADRRASGRALHPAAVLLLGAVWFSVADDESAMWSVQFGWYVVIGGLAVVLLALTPWRRWGWPLGLAGVGAVVASFSALQGLMLWPVGLLCLLWRQRRRDPGAPRAAIIAWLAVGVVCTVAYLKGLRLDQVGPSPLTYILHHPGEGARYLLVLLGNVYTTERPEIGLHEVLGVVVLVAVLATVVGELRGRPGCLPVWVAVAIFGVLFDLSAAIARVGLGLSQATSSRYTMANLLLLLSVAAPALRRARRPARAGRHSAPRRSPGPALLAAAVVAALAIQIGVSTHTGLAQTNAIRGARLLCDRASVERRAMPPAEWRTFIVNDCGPGLIGPGASPLDVLARYRLAQYGPTVAPTLRRLGPP